MTSPPPPFTRLRPSADCPAKRVVGAIFIPPLGASEWPIPSGIEGVVREWLLECGHPYPMTYSQFATLADPSKKTYKGQIPLIGSFRRCVQCRAAGEIHPTHRRKYYRNLPPTQPIPIRLPRANLKCSAILPSGIKCMSKAKIGSEYCRWHQNGEVHPPVPSHPASLIKELRNEISILKGIITSLEESQKDLLSSNASDI